MGWDEQRRYRSDDRDLERCDNDLVVNMGDNGDWYVMIVPHGKRLGPAVRITTSGAPRGQELVSVAIANVYRALGGERMPPIIHRDDDPTDVFIGSTPTPSPFLITQTPHVDWAPLNEAKQLRAMVSELEGVVERERAATKQAKAEAERWRRDAVEDRPAREVLNDLRTLLNVEDGMSIIVAAKKLLATSTSTPPLAPTPTTATIPPERTVLP